MTDAVTGVANAYAARSPLLLIGGAAPLGLRGLGALQEMEQVALLRPITKGAWSVAETRQIPEVLTTAIRVALSGRPGPGVRRDPGGSAARHASRTGWRRSRPATCIARRPPAIPPAIERLAELLAGAERPVVMAGSGVYWDDAAPALAAFAEAAGAPVFMNGAGRGSLPADHPLAFAQARGFALGQADVVLVLGAPLDFRLGYGRPPTFAEDARVCMVDCDPDELGRNRPLAVGIDGHIGRVLGQLTAALPAGTARSLRRLAGAASAAREREARERLDAQCASDDVPVSHYRWAAEIARHVTPDTIVVGDGGDVVGCAAKIVRLQRPGQWLDPGPVRLPRRRPAVRDRRQAPASRPARAADRRRRRLRPQRHGDGDGRALRPADHLHHRQRRRLGADPQPAAVVLRRGACGGDLAADHALRPDGRGAGRARRPRARSPRRSARRSSARSPPTRSGASTCRSIRRRTGGAARPRWRSDLARALGAPGLRITFLAPHVRIAGGVRAILTYADRLAGLGHEVTLVVPAGAAGAAWWRNVRGAGAGVDAGARARIAWVARWAADALPDGRRGRGDGVAVGAGRGGGAGAVRGEVLPRAALREPLSRRAGARGRHLSAAAGARS